MTDDEREQLALSNPNDLFEEVLAARKVIAAVRAYRDDEVGEVVLYDNIFRALDDYDRQLAPGESGECQVMHLPAKSRSLDGDEFFASLVETKCGQWLATFLFPLRDKTFQWFSIETTEDHGIDFVTAELIEASKRVPPLKAIGYDPWGSQRLLTTLIRSGLTMVEVRQGFGLSEHTKTALNLLKNDSQEKSADYEVTRDAAGRVKPARGSHQLRGLVMALYALDHCSIMGHDT